MRMLLWSAFKSADLGTSQICSAVTTEIMWHYGGYILHFLHAVYNFKLGFLIWDARPLREYGWTVLIGYIWNILKSLHNLWDNKHKHHSFKTLAWLFICIIVFIHFLSKPSPPEFADYCEQTFDYTWLPSMYQWKEHLCRIHVVLGEKCYFLGVWTLHEQQSASKQMLHR